MVNGEVVSVLTHMTYVSYLTDFDLYDLGILCTFKHYTYQVWR